MYGMEYPPVIQPEDRIKWKKDHAKKQSGMKLRFCLPNTQSKNSATPIWIECWHQVRQTPSHIVLKMICSVFWSKIASMGGNISIYVVMCEE